ncbi:MAG: phosphate ABC transporter substrate-binding protein PstS [Azospirillaceae bacterium]|nr:phosphate ABC transporter substrate-binding protein PstS [Azospirillaceae bacterium]
MKQVGLAIAMVGSVLCLAGGNAEAAATISGAGATFPYPIYAKWASAYQQATGAELNYQSIGSGGGIKQITAGTVDFGASDMPLEPADLDAAGLTQFPMIMGGVVPVVNIKGVQGGQMKLSGLVLADIYLGKVKKWNDPEIAHLNTNLKLPDTAITVVHRSDGSGTTFIFTNYLAQVNPDWQSKVGVNTAVKWPTGLGGKGNEGVASYSKQANGSIGYVEYAYALQNKLPYVLMQNSAGSYVTPSAETFQAAAANAVWAQAKNFHLILTNQPGANSWPITGASFILVHKKPTDPARVAEALKFFDWAYHNGGPAAAELDYVAMPDNVADLVRKSWRDNITTSAGAPVYDAGSK